MSEPPHDLIDATRHVALGQLRPVDHDDRQSQDARRCELGARSLAAGVLGDDERDRVLAQQRQIDFEREGPSSQHGLRIGQGQRLSRRIDQPQQVVVMRAGCKCGQALPADREKDAGWGWGQRSHGGGDVARMPPVIAGHGRPRRALERDVAHARLGTGQDGVAAHLRREGMRGVDQVSDAFGREISDESRDAAKASDPCLDRLRSGPGRAAGIGVHRRDACSRDGPGELVRLRRPSQQEDALHG